MVEYTNTEYTDIMFVHGEAACNGRAARRVYQEHYPRRVTISHTLFAKVIQRLRKRGTFTVDRANCGTPRRRPTPNWVSLKRPRQRVPESLRVERVCLIVPSGRFSIFSILRTYMQWGQSILRSVLFLHVVPTPLCGRAPVPTTGTLHRWKYVH